MPREHRRRFLKGVGAAGAGLGLSGTAAASDGGLVGDLVDLADETVQEVLVVVDDDAVLESLADLGLAFYEFEVLPLVYLEAPGPTIDEVAALDGVVAVHANRELEWFNDDVRDVTGVTEVTDYDGDGVHVAVIDSGSDPAHPDLALANNYQWVGNPLGSPTLFVSSPIDTDTIGHGTHVSGTVAGSGAQSDGQYAGMAPAATLTAYATGVAVTVLKAAAAFDHLLANHAEEVDLTNNSYGAASADDFDPSLPLNVASKAAYDEGTLSAFAVGNSGPSSDTLSDYAKAPWVLGVAATDDDATVTDFSSRGRPDGNHDRSQALADGTGLYRPGVCAPGDLVVSTMGPADALQATDTSAETSQLPYYAAISGTSMASPAVAGIAALFYDAARSNGHSPTPDDVIATLEATADGSYEPAAGGEGFVDADGAVARAESGDFASL